MPYIRGGGSIGGDFERASIPQVCQADSRDLRLVTISLEQGEGDLATSGGQPSSTVTYPSALVLNRVRN